MNSVGYKLLCIVLAAAGAALVDASRGSAEGPAVENKGTTEQKGNVNGAPAGTLTTFQLSKMHRQAGDKLMEQGDEALKSGREADGVRRFLEAGSEYQKALEANPRNMKAIKGLLAAARQAGERRHNFDTYLLLGYAYLANRDFENAKAAFEACLKEDPNRPELKAAIKKYHLGVARAGEP